MARQVDQLKIPASDMTGTSVDMLCKYCGRPVLGAMLWGMAGPYHTECSRGPSAPNSCDRFPPSAWEVAELWRRIEALERKLAEPTNDRSELRGRSDQAN